MKTHINLYFAYRNIKHLSDDAAHGVPGTVHDFNQSTLAVICTIQAPWYAE